MSLAKLGIEDESIRLFTVRELIEKDWLCKPLDGNHGEIHPKSEDFVTSGVPFVMASDIVNGRIDYTQCSHITRKQADSLRKGFSHNGDVLLTHKATIGRAAIVSYTEQPYIMLTPQVTYYRVNNSREINNKYLRYFFDFQFFQDTIQLWAGAGSTRAYLGITEQQKLPVLLPEIKRQDKIAAVLSAYDDLIENNRRRIELLERMAEELYREWFVRFRFPGYQQAKFEKGLPVDWKRTGLGSLGTYLNGYAFKPSDLSLDGIPVIKIKEINGGVTAETPRNSGESIAKKYHFDDGSIIFSWSATLAVKVWDQGPGLLNQHLFKVAPAEGVPSSFLYFSIKFCLPIFDSLTTGSTMKHIKRKELDAVKIGLPGKVILEEFDRSASTLLQEKLKLSKANQFLVEARNQLLTRLISGKLPVDQLDIQFPPSMREADAARQEVAHA